MLDVSWLPSGIHRKQETFWEAGHQKFANLPGYQTWQLGGEIPKKIWKIATKKIGHSLH